MENQYKIYSLRSPDSEEVRYIGFTKKPLEFRLKKHNDEVYCGKTRKVNWIKSLRTKGLTPIIELIEGDINENDIKQKEINYIKLFKSFGARLVNSTSGGEGLLNPPPDVRYRIGNGNRGKKMPQHVKEKLIASRVGLIPWNKGKKGAQKCSESTKQKLRESSRRANIGKKLSEETKKKIGESGKGRIPWNKGKAGMYKSKPCSEETRRKIGLANKGRPSWHKGRRRSDETREKIRKGLMGNTNGKKKPKDAFGVQFTAQVGAQDQK